MGLKTNKLFLYLDDANMKVILCFTPGLIKAWFPEGYFLLNYYNSF